MLAVAAYLRFCNPLCVTNLVGRIGADLNHRQLILHIQNVTVPSKEKIEAFSNKTFAKPI